MTENDDKKDLWFRYLNKINDRAINKRVASGVNSWVIGVILAGLIFQIIERSAILIVQPEKIPEHFLAFTCMINFVLSVLMFFIVLQIKLKQTSEPRLKSEADLEISSKIELVFFITIIVVATINFICIMFAQEKELWEWPFIVIGLLLLTVLIINVITKPFTEKILKPKLEKELLSLQIHHYLPTKKILVCLFITLSIVLFVASMIPIIQATLKLKNPSHIDATKWAMQASGIFFLTIYLIMNMFRIIVPRRLEIIEEQIVADGISANKIKETFTREISGQKLTDWLKEEEKELIKIQKDIENASSEAKKRLKELSKADQNKKQELKNNRKEICEDFRKKYRECDRYVFDFIKKINRLKLNDNFFTPADIIKLRRQKLLEPLQRILEERKEVCDFCHISTTRIEFDSKVDDDKKKDRKSCL